MKLKRLIIKSFKGRDRVIEFTGRDLFLGRSGSGKTAIVQAAGFAHHGFDPLHLIERRLASDTFRDYSPGGEELCVAVDFDDGFAFERSIKMVPGRSDKVKFEESIKIVGQDLNVTEAAGVISAKLGSSVSAYTLSSFLSGSGEDQLREAMEILVAAGGSEDPRTFVITAALESHLGEDAVKTISGFVENPKASDYRESIVKRGEKSWLDGFETACGKLSAHPNPILAIQDSTRDLKELATEWRATERTARGAVQELVGQKEAVLGAVAGGRETLEKSKADLEAARSEAQRQRGEAIAVWQQAAKAQQQIDELDLKIAPIDPAPLAREPSELDAEIESQGTVVTTAQAALDGLAQSLNDERRTLTEAISVSAADRGTATRDISTADATLHRAQRELAESGVIVEVRSDRNWAELRAAMHDASDLCDAAREATNTALVNLNAELRDIEVRIATETGAIGVDREGIVQIDATLARFADGTCPECLSPVDAVNNDRIIGLNTSRIEIENNVREREGCIVELQASVAAVRGRIENSGTAVRDANAAMRDVKAELADREIREAGQARLAAEQKLAAADESEKAAKQRLGEIETTLTESAERKTLDEATAKLESLKTELRELVLRKLQLANLADLHASRKQLQESIPKQLPELAPLAAKIDEYTNGIIGVNDRLRKYDEMRGVDKQIDIAREKMVKAEKVLDSIGCLTDGLRKLRKQVLETPLAAMEESVTKVYAAVFAGWSAFFRVIEGSRPSLEFGVSDGTVTRRYAGLSTGELLVLLSGVQLGFVSKCPWKLLCLEQITDHLDADTAARLLEQIGNIAGPEVQIIASGHRHGFGAAPDGWKVVEL